MQTDENGYYEFETIHPGAYQIGPNSWRPPHIHYLVQHNDYRPLVTQLYFRGDPHQRGDSFIRPSLIIDLREVASSTACTRPACSTLCWHGGNFAGTIAFATVACRLVTVALVTWMHLFRAAYDSNSGTNFHFYAQLPSRIFDYAQSRL